jgi:biopolymer transport protein TolR
LHGTDSNLGGRRFLAEINVVPLVDVVLVLLIIFMVTAPLLYRGIDIELPKSSTNTIEAKERLVISVEKNGGIFVNKETVSLKDLRPKLQSVKDRNPGVTVYLRADQSVAYGVVIAVMDTVKQVGIDKLGMVTEPPGRKRKI